jgi:RNA polymerase-interacting CarD/CdnL/TRCF family regulator
MNFYSEKEVYMTFHIGDKVIHWTYGLGEIVGIEEKTISDSPIKCYVVRVGNMTIWIPIDELQQRSLRVPTPPEEFTKLFDILTGPGEITLTDRVVRRNQLMAQLKDGQLDSICRVVRDLTIFKRSTKLSDQEKTILERASHSLLAEWSYSMGLSLSQAEEAMSNMLTVSTPALAS